MKQDAIVSQQKDIENKQENQASNVTRLKCTVYKLQLDVKLHTSAGMQPHCHVQAIKHLFLMPGCCVA